MDWILSEYQEKDGIKIPTDLEVAWNLDEGDLSYAEFKIYEIQYDV